MEPEKTDVEVEQVPMAPVLTLTQKNGATSPAFNLIQLDYENLHLATSDILVGTSGAYTDWKAPMDLAEFCDKRGIDLVSGQIVRMPNTTLMPNLDGELTLMEVSELERQLAANVPEDGGTPYEVFDIQEDPGG